MNFGMLFKTKIMLKIKTKKVINCFDFDKLVSETYGKPYCYQQQDDCKERGTEHFSVPCTYIYDEDMNDSIPEVINGEEMGVKFNVWLDRDPEEWNGEEEDKRFLDMFWGRNFYPDFNTLINDLHKKGLIEAGSYVMEIDW
jgi:hypothetical protein